MRLLELFDVDSCSLKRMISRRSVPWSVVSCREGSRERRWPFLTQAGAEKRLVGACGCEPETSFYLKALSEVIFSARGTRRSVGVQITGGEVECGLEEGGEVRELAGCSLLPSLVWDGAGGVGLRGWV